MKLPFKLSIIFNILGVFSPLLSQADTHCSFKVYHGIDLLKDSARALSGDQTCANMASELVNGSENIDGSESTVDRVEFSYTTEKNDIIAGSISRQK